MGAGNKYDTGEAKAVASVGAIKPAEISLGEITELLQVLPGILQAVQSIEQILKGQPKPAGVAEEAYKQT